MNSDPRLSSMSTGTIGLSVPEAGGADLLARDTSSLQRPAKKASHLALVRAAGLVFAIGPWTVVGEPRPIISLDSSVILASQHLRRRRVSLNEAREVALEVLRLAEQRRMAFAQLEGTNNSFDLRVP